MDAMACRFSWHLQYQEGYRPKRKNINLELGTGIHLALERWYGMRADPVEVFTSWADGRIQELEQSEAAWIDDIQKFYEARALGIAMLLGYKERYAEETFDVVATEHTLRRRLPIPKTERLSQYWLVARLDGIVRDKATGQLYSLEHKTFERMNTEQLELDHQMSAQVWLGQDLVSQMGLDGSLIGVIYNGLRKQTPGPRVSVPLFERHVICRTEQHIRIMLHRAYWKAKEMLSNRNLPIYPDPNPMRCSWCDFKVVCTEYMRGGDFRFLLKELYDKRGEPASEAAE
jgi:hypothetical protein